MTRKLENGGLKCQTTDKDEAIEWPVDIQPLTGGPFLWKELVSRQRNGQIIELYKLA